MLVPGWAYLCARGGQRVVLSKEFYGNKPKRCIDPGITKIVFRGAQYRAHSIRSIEIFAENGYNRTFLENVIIEHNATKKSNDSRSYTKPPPQKKILWVPNIGPEIRKEFRKVTKDHCKDITFTSGKNSQKMSKSTEATT